MMIPHEQLPAETLRSLLEEFITREGTDYGSSEISLDTKVEQLMRQLKRGEVVIVFDAATESTSLMTRHEFQQNGTES